LSVCSGQNVSLDKASITAMDEQLKYLQRDIDTLRESNRLAWHELEVTPMTPTERLALRKAIATRDIELFDLIERKWALTSQRA
jgi:hypothetical protein